MFGKARKLVGLDIGSSALKAVELKRRKGKYELVSLGIEPLAADLVGESGLADVGAVAGAIERLFAEQKFGSRDVATSVAGRAVIVRQLAAPGLEGAELGAWVESVAAQHVPFDPGDVHLSYQVFNGDRHAGSHALVLVAAKKEKVDSHREAIRRAGWNPAVMDIDAFALANCYEANAETKEGETTALIDLGASLANITMVRDGTPLFTRDVAVGGRQFTDALEREFRLEAAEAERVMRGESEAVPKEQRELMVQSFLEMVVEEIGRTFDYFRAGGERAEAAEVGEGGMAGKSGETKAGERIDRVLVTGGAARLPNFVEMLHRQFGVPAAELDPLREIEIPGERFDEASVRRLAPQLAVSVGLALRSFDPA